MEKKYLDITIIKEKLSNGNLVYVAHCPTLGITSQGSTVEEAQDNIKEAIDLYLEEMPEKYEEISVDELPLFSLVEVKKRAELLFQKNTAV